ncbi:CCA tRNA nucleotidyltransferase [Agromyces sp. NPDC057679]|uniref:CCA tRNA nucleotidyltransferase n=1 Tax=Agromyces sp. NPDC057679 TaxID=3346207 RepID=UPI00366D359F
MDYQRDTLGRFDRTHTRPEASIPVQTTSCRNCSTDRILGAPHRCPAPGLIALTGAAELVLEACRAAGGQPLIVGGAVRDALKNPGGTPKDVDIEVHNVDGFGRIKEELTARGVKVDEVGVSFGVLKAVAHGEDFDISLPRRDSKTGAGYRGFTVEFDPSIGEVEAFARRDFTVNSIGFDPTTGELVDPFGGVNDLHDGILRHTSEAFSEDPLRVLRAVQFAARFDLELADDTAELAESISDTFSELATERVWQEFRKLARAGRKPSRALEVLERTGWLRHFPALAATRGCEQDPHWHPEGDVFTHLGMSADAAVEAADRYQLDDEARERVVLAALLHDIGKPATTETRGGRITSYEHEHVGAGQAREFLLSIGAPKQTAEWVGTIVREHMRPASVGANPSKYAVRKLSRRLGDVPVIEWAAVVDADHGGRGAGSKPTPTAKWLALYEQLGDTATSPRLLRGEHLIKRGLRPGESFRTILTESQDAQDRDVFSDVAGALAWLDEYLVSADRD